MPATLFVSHASADDGFVRQLQQALAELGQPVWIDSRELRGGDPLWSVIQAAIQAAGAFAVIVSPASLQSRWVADELEYALEVRQLRQAQGIGYRVVPLSLDGTQLGFAQKLFGEEPLYIPIGTAPSGLEEALRAIAAALGLRLPAELPSPPPTQALPLEELVLELTEPGFEVWDGKRRPKARARLIHQPAAQGRRTVESPSAWEFVAPIGPIEANEIRWYLEQYAVWPGNAFKPRAAKVEAQLAEWGRLLHEAALPAGRVDPVLQAWAGMDGAAERRFSVYLREGVGPDAGEEQREAAAALLGLPWELLHEDGVFLFQGAKPTRVRRRLPNTRPLDRLTANPPVRILLITARPEDEACGYIDHRASALPLVQAMEKLGGLVELSLEADPPLFARLPSRSAMGMTAERRTNKLKHLPPEPETGFIGRSRELLALERLLFGNGARHAVILGNGGEGKTALAAELGRWLVRTRRVERAAFVSVERDGNAASVLNALLAQLVVSARVKQATADDLEPALLEVQRVLEERPTLLVLDNMESLLPLPWLQDPHPRPLSQREREL